MEYVIIVFSLIIFLLFVASLIPLAMDILLYKKGIRITAVITEVKLKKVNVSGSSGGMRLRRFYTCSFENEGETIEIKTDSSFTTHKKGDVVEILSNKKMNYTCLSEDFVKNMALRITGAVCSFAFFITLLLYLSSAINQK